MRTLTWCDHRMTQTSRPLPKHMCTTCFFKWPCASSIKLFPSMVQEKEATPPSVWEKGKAVRAGRPSIKICPLSTGPSQIVWRPRTEAPTAISRVAASPSVNGVVVVDVDQRRYVYPSNEVCCQHLQGGRVGPVLELGPESSGMRTTHSVRLTCDGMCPKDAQTSRSQRVSRKSKISLHTAGDSLRKPGG